MGSSRAWVLTLLLVLSALVPGPAPAAPASGASVPSSQGGTLHNGSVYDPALHPPLTLAWSSPVFDLGRFPVVVDDTVVMSSYDAVYAFDLTSGTSRWTRTLTSSSVDGTDVGAGLVHVATNDCVVVALDPLSGDTRWVRKLPGTALGSCTTSPVTRRGITFVQAKSSANRLVALDARTGEIRWSQDIGYAGVGTPVVTHDRVIVSGLITTRAFDLAGHPLWSSDCCGQENGWGDVAAIADGRLYVGFDGAVLDPDTGERVGTVPPGKLAVGHGVVVVVQYDRVVAVDEEGGAPLWSVPRQQPSNTAPMIVNDVVYVESVDGSLEALTLENGDQAWSVDLGSQLYAPEHGFAVADGLLLVPAFGALRAYATAG